MCWFHFRFHHWIYGPPTRSAHFRLLRLATFTHSTGIFPTRMADLMCYNWVTLYLQREKNTNKIHKDVLLPESKIAFKSNFRKIYDRKMWFEINFQRNEANGNKIRLYVHSDDFFTAVRRWQSIFKLKNVIGGPIKPKYIPLKFLSPSI